MRHNFYEFPHADTIKIYFNINEKLYSINTYQRAIAMKLIFIKLQISNKLNSTKTFSVAEINHYSWRAGSKRRTFLISLNERNREEKFSSWNIKQKFKTDILCTKNSFHFLPLVCFYFSLEFSSALKLTIALVIFSYFISFPYSFILLFVNFTLF